MSHEDKDGYSVSIVKAVAFLGYRLGVGILVCERGARVMFWCKRRGCEVAVIAPSQDCIRMEVKTSR